MKGSRREEEGGGRMKWIGEGREAFDHLIPSHPFSFLQPNSPPPHRVLLCQFIFQLPIFPFKMSSPGASIYVAVPNITINSPTPSPEKVRYSTFLPSPFTNSFAHCQFPIIIPSLTNIFFVFPNFSLKFVFVCIKNTS